MNKEKITEPGQPCRHCGAPVVKRIPRSKPQGNRKYYFEFFLRCPKCRRIYLVESAKKFWSEKSKLEGVSPALLQEAHGKVGLPENDFGRNKDNTNGATPSKFHST